MILLLIFFLSEELEKVENYFNKTAMLKALFFHVKFIKGNFYKHSQRKSVYVSEKIDYQLQNVH